jgi:hypothetical protein
MYGRKSIVFFWLNEEGLGVLGSGDLVLVFWGKSVLGKGVLGPRILGAGSWVLGSVVWGSGGVGFG